MKVHLCITDDDYEAWRAVRIAVVPSERCGTVAELRAQAPSSRRLLIADLDGTVVGSGMADRSDSADVGFVAPRVLPEFRHLGAGSALLRALAEHCTGLGLPAVRAHVDEGSLAFATHFGFVEVDREIEQVRAVGDEPAPSAMPSGVEIATLSQHPGLWEASYEKFGRDVLADLALHTPLEISAAQWNTDWRGEPMFLAMYEGDVIGCAGLNRDTDRPERGENTLTAVRRDWRGRGIATHLKRRTLRWAAANGVRELYTWTQAGNAAMRRLNGQLGYVTGQTSITVSRPLPLEI